MTVAPLTPVDRGALRQFVDAVLALSDDPDSANVERYLAASRSLEESQRRTERPRHPSPGKENAR